MELDAPKASKPSKSVTAPETPRRLCVQNSGACRGAVPGCLPVPLLTVCRRYSIAFAKGWSNHWDVCSLQLSRSLSTGLSLFFSQRKRLGHMKEPFKYLKNIQVEILIFECLFSRVHVCSPEASMKSRSVEREIITPIGKH